MAFAQSGGEDSKAAGLSLNLPSNNPFRNRTTSPVSSGQLPPMEPPPRPLSRNPFLDDAGTVKESLWRLPSPSAKPAPSTGSATAELFDELTLDDKPRSSRPQQPARSLTDTSRAENIPPNGSVSHRPTRSQDRRPPGPPRTDKPQPRLPTNKLDIFADPTDTKPNERRPRRNSDSSLMGGPSGGGKALDPVEENKRQDRRRRERRQREREALKDPKKPSRKLDIIDQLDATSIYGMGVFHHDGPFDACNPHRNRQGSRRAPMQAFPKDSLNNALVGGPPMNRRPNHAAFLGNNDEEAFKDFSTGGGASTNYESYGGRANGLGAQPSVQSSTMKVEPVHGDESLGLGTSTFLEGAPASKAAIQRTAAETAGAESAAAKAGGGLARKKSLAQKIRGINNPRREFAPGPARRGSSNDSRPSPSSPGQYGNAGRKESITFREPENKPTRSPPGCSPGREGPGARLERRVTTDSTGGEEAAKPGLGFLSRVKSLKGGPKRPKADKPVFD
ncbi:hypothetical protein VC83_00043 [Pseudogymnoascus destructans]|uniref:Pal1 cell morphology protein n=1 Tax=Pseudogymnoascus destructans TaxID=655981 RepID=A0A177APH9_9PEZI|nr:uncharacterized protein VC83_00043 [Pseudogymnoascus destructans]OAF63291.1 hypothetical protein VC83_00043 [Pseudogymnoascus destructans]